MASSLLQNSKFDELCRLCAAKTELVLSVHIFEGDGPIRQLSKKIDTCLQLQVHQQDQLPKIICEDCLYKLEMFWDFKDRSFRTEQLLIELYKQFKHESSQHAQEQCIVSIDSNGLILQVPHHQILSESLHSVSDIDISQLGHRDNPENYAIILQQHSELNAHSLENLDLNNHDLTGQDLSNQSLHTQENLVVTSSSHDIQGDQRFSEANLSLMQHHLLSEAQFRIQHELQVSMASENNIVDGYRLPDNLKHSLSHPSDQNFSEKNEESHSLETVDYSNQKNSLTVDSNLSDNSLGVEVDSHLNRIITYSSDSQIDQLRHHDESNSGGNILVDDEMNSVNVVISKGGYLLTNHNIENHEPEDLLHLNANFFTCNLCGKTFEERVALESHYQTHFFKCETAADEVNLENKNNNHGILEYEENSKTSDSDQKILNAKEDVDSMDGFKNEDSDSIESPPTPEIAEINELSNEPPLGDNSRQSPISEQKNPGSKSLVPKVCTECGKLYKTNYKLAEHMRKHTGERPYKCKSCEKTFRSKIGLAQHEAKHTGHYDFSCPTCGKGFQCKSYLMVHQRVHSDLKPYPCTTCGQNFKTKQSLLDHTNRHLGVKPYLCDICGRGFITKGLCRAHVKTHSGTDNRKYSCKICTKMFVSKSYLQTHLRIHTGEKPFMCEVCGKGFLTRVDLKVHSTMHTGEKSYVCEMCGKAFARRDALRCHRRSHTGERPYSCDLCGQTFTQFTPMAIHKRLHTGERPYSCETCGRSFVSRSTMMSHAKKHVKKEDDAKSIAVPKANEEEDV